MRRHSSASIALATVVALTTVLGGVGTAASKPGAGGNGWSGVVAISRFYNPIPPAARS